MDNQVAVLLDRLAVDTAFLSAVKEDRAAALNACDLPSEIQAAILARNPVELRALESSNIFADIMAMTPTWYTKGPKCSTACTKLGCIQA